MEEDIKKKRIFFTVTLSRLIALRTNCKKAGYSPYNLNAYIREILIKKEFGKNIEKPIKEKKSAFIVSMPISEIDILNAKSKKAGFKTLNPYIRTILFSGEELKRAKRAVPNESISEMIEQSNKMVLKLNHGENERVSFSVTPSELAILKAKSEAAGYSRTASYVRDILINTELVGTCKFRPTYERRKHVYLRIPDSELALLETNREASGYRTLSRYIKDILIEEIGENFNENSEGSDSGERKQRGSGRKKTEIIYVRVTPEEKANLKSNCEAAGYLSLTKYIVEKLAR